MVDHYKHLIAYLTEKIEAGEQEAKRLASNGVYELAGFYNAQVQAHKNVLEGINMLLKEEKVAFLRKETGASLADCEKIVEANPTGTIEQWKDDLRRFGKKI